MAICGYCICKRNNSVHPCMGKKKRHSTASPFSMFNIPEIIVFC